MYQLEPEKLSFNRNPAIQPSRFEKEDAGVDIDI
jgi:hypothetical protein